MSKNTEKTAKSAERAKRNLAAAKKSRAHRKLQRAELGQRMAYLQERAALDQLQLALLPTVGGLQAVPGGPSISPGGGGGGSGEAPSRPGMVRLSDYMRRLLGGRKEVPGDDLVDLLDRVVNGGKGKPPPRDPELVRLWAEAARNAPKNPTHELREAARAAGVDVDSPTRHETRCRGRKSAKKGGGGPSGVRKK